MTTYKKNRPNETKNIALNKYCTVIDRNIKWLFNTKYLHNLYINYTTLLYLTVSFIVK